MLEMLLWACGGAVVFGVLVVGLRGTELDRALKHARRTGEVDELARMISASASAGQATRWDHAIGSLWRAYARQPATLLVVQAAANSEADIVQYWIGQILQVEPELAQQHFSEEFLAQHFRPDIASRCGRKGCCGG